MVGVRRFRHAFFRLTGRQNGINLQAGKNEVTVASAAETKIMNESLSLSAADDAMHAVDNEA
jgi:hypothetical protein